MKIKGATNDPFTDGYVLTKPGAPLPTEWSDETEKGRFPGVFVMPLGGAARLVISCSGLLAIPNEDHSTETVMRAVRRMVTETLGRHRKAHAHYQHEFLVEIDALPMPAARALAYKAARLTGFQFEGDAPDLDTFGEEAVA